MTLVLDAGALIALERNDRAMWRRLKAAQSRGEIPVCHGGVIGQAWRGEGPRQTLLVNALAAIDVRSLDETLGRAAGELLAKGSLNNNIYNCGSARYSGAIARLYANGDQARGAGHGPAMAASPRHAE